MVVFLKLGFKNKGGISVIKRSTYVVGDSEGKGGELFIPNSSGQITQSARGSMEVVQ